MLNESWTTPEQVAQVCGDLNLELIEEPILTSWINFASVIMWGKSGRQWPGVQSTLTIERPVAQSCDRCAWRHPSNGLGSASFYDSTTLRGGLICAGRCRLDRVRLAGPVHDVAEVKLNGVTLDPSTYELRRETHLYRLDGKHWPCCQNLAAADDQDGTFSVSFHRGGEVPDEGALCAAILCCELLKASQGMDCVLPPGVAEVMRDGVLYNLDADLEAFFIGRTGIRTIDLWLSVVNPGGRTRRAGVWRADDPRRGAR